jgi:hypothetical protein
VRFFYQCSPGYLSHSPSWKLERPPACACCPTDAATTTGLSGWNRCDRISADHQCLPAKSKGRLGFPRAVPRIVWAVSARYSPNRSSVRATGTMARDARLAWAGRTSRAAAACYQDRSDRATERRQGQFADGPQAVDSRHSEQRGVGRLSYRGPRLRHITCQPPAVCQNCSRLRGSLGQQQGRGVFPSFVERAPPSQTPGPFLMAIDGEPVAWTGSHGQSLDWFGS